MIRPAHDEAGILRPRAAHEKFAYQRHAARGRLADHVLNFWTVSWDLDEPFTAQVLPLPTVNLSVTNTEADVTGLVRRRYDRRLVGSGFAVGARFRPACFRPFLGSSVSALTDTHRPIAEVLGRDTASLKEAVRATEDAPARVRVLAEFLATIDVRPDPLAFELADLVGDVMASPDILRVADVAALAGVSVRTVQRRFVEYVGAGPKWVIALRRLLEVAARAGEEVPPDWAALAVSLGFADQAHLSRTFTATVGTSPAAYTRS